MKRYTDPEDKGQTKKRDNAFFRIDRLVRNEGLSRMKLNPLKILMAMFVHADFQSAVAYPGVDALAKLTGMSRGNASTARKWLVDHGVLRVLERGGGTRNTMHVEITGNVPPGRNLDKSANVPNSDALTFRKRLQTFRPDGTEPTTLTISKNKEVGAAKAVEAKASSNSSKIVDIVPSEETLIRKFSNYGVDDRPARKIIHAIGRDESHRFLKLCKFKSSRGEDATRFARWLAKDPSGTMREVKWPPCLKPDAAYPPAKNSKSKSRDDSGKGFTTRNRLVRELRGPPPKEADEDEMQRERDRKAARSRLTWDEDDEDEEDDRPRRSVAAKHDDD